MFASADLVLLVNKLSAVSGSIGDEVIFFIWYWSPNRLAMTILMPTPEWFVSLKENVVGEKARDEDEAKSRLHVDESCGDPLDPSELSFANLSILVTTIRF